MMPVAYRPIICFSRSASGKSCASGRLQPCYRFWRSYIYTLRRHAADSVPHFERSLWWPWYKIPCAYIWVPFQLRRSLVAFGIDLPVMSVHGAGAYDATASPAWNQTQHPIFYGYTRLGSAAYPLKTSQIPPQRLELQCLSAARSPRKTAYMTPIN